MSPATSPSTTTPRSSRSLKVVDGQYRGLIYLFEKKHKIPVFMGRGALLDATTVGVTPNDGSAPFTIQAKNVIINTGSRPRPIKGVPYDGMRVINSDHAVVLDHLPKSFIIRGGGATGVEWASVYHRYGTKVTLVGNVVPMEDDEVSGRPRPAPSSARRWISSLGARPTADDIDVGKNGVTMRLKDAKGKERTVEAEVLLVAIGRQGNIEDIGLEEVGVKTEGEYIPVDDMMRTNVRASTRSATSTASSCSPTPPCTTASSPSSTSAVSTPSRSTSSTPPPAPTASRRSAASVCTEKQAKEIGHNVKIGKFPMKPNAKAIIEGHTDGFTKMVADADTNDLLGVHIIGPHATELIAEAGLARLLESTPVRTRDHRPSAPDRLRGHRRSRPRPARSRDPHLADGLPTPLPMRGRGEPAMLPANEQLRLSLCRGDPVWSHCRRPGHIDWTTAAPDRPRGSISGPGGHLGPPLQIRLPVQLNSPLMNDGVIVTTTLDPPPSYARSSSSRRSASTYLAVIARISVSSCMLPSRTVAVPRM